MSLLTRILHRARRYLPQNTQKVFRSIYQKNRWGSSESVSGPGSTLAYTETLRKELPALLNKLGVKQLLDAPCGDCHWINSVSLDGINYTGADIVPELVERNREQYPGKNFIVANLITDPLPAADLVLCRDCFIHLPNKDVLAVIRNIKRSGTRYLLASTYPVKRNTEILTGHFRPVNLELPPFNLPAPFKMLKDYPDGEEPRFLGLWELDLIE